MIEFLPIGLAGLYLWMLASQLHTPLILPVQRWLRRGWRRPLVSCAYCFGWWVSLLMTIAVQWGRWGWIETPMVALAAAAIVGVVGSNWTAGVDDEPE